MHDIATGTATNIAQHNGQAVAVEMEVPEGEIVIQRFEKLKKSSTLLREAVDLSDSVTVWEERQGNNEGPLFFCKRGVRGGQWNAPTVFGHRGGSSVGSPFSRAPSERGYMGASLKNSANDTADWRHQIRSAIDLAKPGERREHDSAEGLSEQMLEMGAADVRQSLIDTYRKLRDGGRDVPLEAFEETKKESSKPHAPRPASASAAGKQVKAVAPNADFPKYVGPTLDETINAEKYGDWMASESEVSAEPDSESEEDEELERYRAQHSGDSDDDSDLEGEEGAMTKNILRSVLPPATLVKDNDGAVHDRTPPDFSKMYARAVVVRQQFPWTHLVDIETQTKFYRNEETNKFQYDVPSVFKKGSHREAANADPDDAFDDYEEALRNREDEKARKKVSKALKEGEQENGVITKVQKKIKPKKGGMKKKPKVKKVPDYSSTASVLGMLQPGDLQADIDSRYKDELHVRRSALAANTKGVVDGVANRPASAAPTSTGEEGPDRYLRNDVASLRALSRSKKDGTKNVSSSDSPGCRRSNSIFVRSGDKSVIERYAAPTGMAQEALDRSIARAKTISGFRSGFLFLTHRPSKELIKSRLDIDNGKNHGLHGSLQNNAVDWRSVVPRKQSLHDDSENVEYDLEGLANGPASGKAGLSQEKVHKRDAATLGQRLVRLATDSQLPGYLATDRYVKKEVIPSTAYDDIELEKHREKSRRALVINEMRNQERAIAVQLNAQLTMMDAEQPTWIENEINRRYLLEAACMQRSHLIMPRSARLAKAYPQVPSYLKTPNFLQTEDIDSLRAEGFNVATATDGSWTVYKINPQHDSGRAVSIYINHQKGLTQQGEPFDLRCRRSRGSFKVEKWSQVSKILPKAAVIQRHNIQMLSDPDGGLLYYNPIFDRYSSNDQFDMHVSTEDVRETVKTRIKMREKLLQGDEKQIVRDAKSLEMSKAPKKISTNYISAKIAGYKHKVEPNVERNILHYPETNIWAGILLPPRQNDAAKSLRLSTTSSAAGPNTKLAASVDTTPRSLVGPVRDLSSPRAGVTPGPRDYTQFDEPDSVSRPLTRPSSHHNLATNFVGEVTVEMAGTLLRPFSAGEPSQLPPRPRSAIPQDKSRPAPSGALSVSVDGTNSLSLDANVHKQRTANEPMAKLILEQQEVLAALKPANIRFTKSMLDPTTLPPISFEEEMDNQSYATYREYVHKLAEEPRNPVTLLYLSNFLYSQKMDDECMAVLTRTIEVLKEWNLAAETDAMIKILQSKVGIRVNGEYENLDVMKGHAVTCRDSPTILSQVALYYNRLKYIEQAEQLYIAALLLDPLHSEANRGYAHVLIQKSNFNAANRYFVRVPESSISYSIVKTEMGWLQEMKAADDEAVLLAFKRCLALGNRDRGTCCALYSLGHFFHVRSDFQKAVDFYRRALLYNPNEHQTLLLLGCLGNLLPQAYTKYQVDAWLRRGLLCQPHGSAKWVGLVIYAESLISNFQDLDRAEVYLWTAARDSFTKEIWAILSLSHYYQYTRCDPQRAKRLLLWSARSREKSRNLKINADDAIYTHNKQFEGNDAMASGSSGFGSFNAVKSGAEMTQDPADDGNSYFKRKVSGEEAILYIAAAYACMDMSDWDHAIIHARKALLMDDSLGPAHRCLGLLLFRDRSSRKQAINHFNVSLDLSTLNPTSSAYNPYSLRTGAVVMAIEGNYAAALRTMEASCQACCNNPVAWRVLGIMTYLYGEGGAKANAQRASEFLLKAIELSGGIDLDAMILRGQLLMEIGKAKEARTCYEQAMTIVPSDSLLLASYAICLSSIGYKSPYGTVIADYEIKFAQMKSMGELATSEDPEELYLAAVSPSLKKSIDKKNAKYAASREQPPSEGKKAQTILSSSPQILDEIPAILEASRVNAGANDAYSNEIVDVPPEVLYWYAMHQLSENKADSQEKAHKYFTRSVQRSDCPPHPLSLYMLGWLSELKGDLVVAERYYCYAVQLDPIDVVYFLKLLTLVTDTMTFVKGLEKMTEKSESTRKKLLKKKLKMRRKGISVPIGPEGDESGEQATNLIMVRRRLLLHERVHKLAILRKKEIGKRVHALNTPGKTVHIEPFWRERALHAFSECDDWASMLRTSNYYNNREVEK